jgi:hypothetical protein
MTGSFQSYSDPRVQTGRANPRADRGRVCRTGFSRFGQILDRMARPKSKWFSSLVCTSHRSSLTELDRTDDTRSDASELPDRQHDRVSFPRLVGEIRACVGLRILMTPDAFPSPRLEEAFATFRGAQCTIEGRTRTGRRCSRLVPLS